MSILVADVARTSIDVLSTAEHVHDLDGTCVKHRTDLRCTEKED